MWCAAPLCGRAYLFMRRHELRAPQLVGRVGPVATGGPFPEDRAKDLGGQVITRDALGREVPLLRRLDHELRDGRGVDDVVHDVLRVRRAHREDLRRHRCLGDADVQVLDQLRAGRVEHLPHLLAGQLHLRRGQADQPVGLRLDHVLHPRARPPSPRGSSTCGSGTCTGPATRSASRPRLRRPATGTARDQRELMPWPSWRSRAERRSCPGRPAS